MATAVRKAVPVKDSRDVSRVRFSHLLSALAFLISGLPVAHGNEIVTFSGDVFFSANGAVVTPDEGSRLDYALSHAQEIRGGVACAVIVGHADRFEPGMTDAGALSRARAEAVADVLKAKGYSAERLNIEGKGATQPVFTPPNQRNARVEMELVPCPFSASWSRSTGASSPVPDSSLLVAPIIYRATPGADVFFDLYSAVPTPAQRKSLDGTLAIAARLFSLLACVHIDGNADQPEASMMDTSLLSQARANAVAEIVKSAGYPQDHLDISWKGASQPVFRPPDQRNARVEIEISPCQTMRKR